MKERALALRAASRTSSSVATLLYLMFSRKEQRKTVGY
jgi:hypothetical protein